VSGTNEVWQIMWREAHYGDQFSVKRAEKGWTRVANLIKIKHRLGRKVRQLREWGRTGRNLTSNLRGNRGMVDFPLTGKNLRKKWKLDVRR